MKTGLLTNSFTWAGMKDLYAIESWAVENGLSELEIGPDIVLDEKVFSDILAMGRVKVSAFIYCRNFLDADPSVAGDHIKALEDRIEFSHKLGVKKIVCSTGVDIDSFKGMSYEPELSLKKVIEFLKRMIDLAEKRNVKICLENCPMMGNIAVSPYIWSMLFDKIKSDRIGLAYDPSHLIWQCMDPYENIIEYKRKIYHFHAKDTKILNDNLSRMGILQNSKWWQHKIPGDGDLMWGRIIENLYKIGYNDTISIELEDPVYDGDILKVKEGIIKSNTFINNLIQEKA